jgi:hypothetical protein
VGATHRDLDGISVGVGDYDLANPFSVTAVSECFDDIIEAERLADVNWRDVAITGELHGQRQQPVPASVFTCNNSTSDVPLGHGVSDALVR